MMRLSGLAVMLAASLAQAATPTTLSVTPVFTGGGLGFPLQSYTDVDGNVVVVCDGYSLTADQLGINLVDYGERRWRSGKGYRRSK